MTTKRQNNIFFFLNVENANQAGKLIQFKNISKQTMRLVCLLCVIMISLCSTGSQVYTYVTTMFDIKRGGLKVYQYKRPFSYYLAAFQQFLKIDANLIVFGPKKLEKFVWERRLKQNTVFIVREVESLKDIWYAPFTERIRQKVLADPAFVNKHYPQFALEYYNPLIMSKLYFLDAALVYDRFNSDFFIWCDGAYNHIFQNNVVWPQNAMTKYYQLLQPQWTFFNYNDYYQFIMGYHNSTFPYVGRKAELGEGILAGNFGGYVRAIQDVKFTYENLLRITLENGDLNSDETVIAMMFIKYTYLFPSASHVRFDYYVDRIQIGQGSKRVPSHPRLLSVGFDEEGNLLARDEKKLTKYEIPILVKSAFLANKECLFYENIVHRQITLLVLILLFYVYVLRKTSDISKMTMHDEKIYGKREFFFM